jgi:uncharacterized membrane protein
MLFRLAIGILVAAGWWGLSQGNTAAARVLDRVRDGLVRGLRRERSFWVLLVLISVWYLILKYRQHWSLHTYAYDLSLFDYALTNTVAGNFMYTPLLGRNFFSEHFSPVLLFLVPLYTVISGPLVLLTVQALATAAAAVPLFILGKREYGDRAWAAGLALVYLNYHMVARCLLYDFHFEMFGPVLFFAFLASRRPGKWVLPLVLLSLYLGVKEDTCINGAMAGLYFIVMKKDRRFGAAVLGASVLYGVLLFTVIFPYLHGPLTVEYRFWSRYSHWGAGPGQIILGLLTHPGALVQSLMNRTAAEFLVPLALLPVLSPTLLLTLPSYWLNALANDVQQHKFYFYYSATVLPFLFLAALHGLQRVRKWPRLGRYRPLLWAVLVPLNLGYFPHFSIDRDARDARQALHRIPAGAASQAGNTLFPHLPFNNRNQVGMSAGPDREWIAQEADIPPLERQILADSAYVLVFENRKIRLYHRIR